MIPLLEQHRDAIAELCKKHGVARLDVFGSASDGTFDPARSDVDLIVAFDSDDPGMRLRNHLALIEAFETLFGRHVDLLTDSMIRNRFFRRQVEASRSTLYAA